ncbi:mechanosensitive ion channel domain-containing protein [Sedimenticola hydrogenitrophicus]|uniref:mechanosensitive ion channel domain-containing protein n=1 Tax=Sedimenticola hydrogenitrophicus TaxID=2967975 RepID=UPI0021A94CCA
MHNFSIQLQLLFKVLLFSLLGLLLTLPAVAAQEGTQTTPPGTTIPGIEGTKAKIGELEAASGQEGADNGELDNYRQTLEQLQQAEKEQQQAELYKQTVDNAEQQLNQLRNALSRFIKQSSQPAIVANLSAEELTRRYNQSLSERQLAQTQLQDLEEQRAVQRVRPEQSGMELADTKRQLEETENRLNSDTSGTLPAHRKQLLLASQLMLKNKINRLQLERLSHTHRMDQLALRIELGQARLKQADTLVQLLQERVSSLQVEEAQQARQQAEIVQQQAAGKHPLIQQYADQNAELSQRLSQLATQTEATTLELEKTLARKEAIRQSQERVQQQITIGGLDEQPGGVLQKQRSELPRLADLQKSVNLRRAQIAAARLESFRIEDRRQQLRAELGHNLMSTIQPEELTEAEWSGILEELKQLLENRLLLLDKVKTAYGRYEKVLADLSAEQLQLYDRVKQYSDLLDRHLLWIPSTTRIGGATFTQAIEALGWFFSADNWANAAEGLATGLERYPYRVILLAIVLGLLLRNRGKMYRRLDQIAPAVGNVTRDSFKNTVHAFLITLLLALPWPLLMAALGWWLTTGSDHSFIVAVSIGLRRVAVFFFIIQIVRYLFIPNGLAEVHFRWDPANGKLFRHHMHWLVAALVPLAFTVGVFEWVENATYTDSLGRLAFIAGLLVTALFFHRLLNPWSGFLAVDANANRSDLSRLWYPAAMLVNLSLTLLAIEGYYFSALNLERMVFLSLISGVLIFLVYHLFVRWLLVAERRLALARAKARRQAAQEAKIAREAADAAGEGMPELAEFEAVNLATINEQTRRLLRVGSGLVFATLLYLIWEQLTPALSWLNAVVLWQFESGSGQLANISLWDGLLALVALMLTLIAGRNLPGLLEIALLQPMNLDLGNRYAVSSMSRYVIYGGGALLVLNLIGLQWSDVQWLVAAMGVGLGFGLKEIFANFFSGILILFERPIRIGDTVTIGDISGTVSRIRIRATTITDWDNKELVVPNKNFITDPLINWTLSDPITRIVIKVGIAYGSDTDQALRIMTQVVERHPDVMKEPRATIFFTGFGDSSLDFDIRVFVSDNLKRMPLIHDLHMALNKALAEGGIEIPFPQRDLHLRSVAPGINPRGEDKA